MRISLLEPFGWSQPRARPGFGGGHGEERLHQLGIERGAQADGLRKTGAADGGMAVQALFAPGYRPFSARRTSSARLFLSSPASSRCLSNRSRAWAADHPY